MARRVNTRGKRGVSATTKRYTRLPYRAVLRPIDLSVFEDRRRYYPDTLVVRKQFRPPATLSSLQGGRVTMASRSRNSLRGLFFQPQFPVFKEAKRVIMCLRRAARREVLHAFKQTGSGSGKRQQGKLKSRNDWSAVKC